jgi:hypothetical protein
MSIPTAGDAGKPRLPWQAPAPGDTAQHPALPSTGGASGDAHYYQQIKGRVHRRLIERLTPS